MSKFYLFTHFFNAAVLVRFAISKLFAWPISVAAFVEMAKPLGIDPTFFRIFTGITLTVVIIGYATSLFLVAKKGFPSNKESLYVVGASNLLGGTVMIGALFSEFLLRLSPKWPLVYIALAIVVFSALNLNQLRYRHALAS
ncbi:hypothetical protein DB30_00169 [Enhygromyxa salina]|uniref:Uncharacterized protein n=1 Tax=Enhygromyxa salina TaxID=215803 RepID=A0A0C2DDZ8_9BACT|nr:hypothetical protein [Enhygromyxa salina]KIG19660.1 hypothetical protein DB30_00169 [Enhygromyxa salina]